MTPPRQILAGQTFDISSRTHGREFRFPPDHIIRELFLYIVAVAAARYQIDIYGLVLMANHYHIVGRDREGRLPRFVQYVNSFVARAINARQGRDDGVWSRDGYSLVRPQSPEDLVERLVYGMANPVEAGVVARAEEYPGIVLLPRDAGTRIEVNRPDWFFSPNGCMPAKATLEIAVPDGLGDLEAYRQLVSERLGEVTAACRRERRELGLGTLGVRRATRLRVGDRPSTREAWFRLRPTIAAKQAEVRAEAIQRLQSFREAYRIAYCAYRDGDTSVAFPTGTWWMVQHAGACLCEPPD